MHIFCVSDLEPSTQSMVQRYLLLLLRDVDRNEWHRKVYGTVMDENKVFVCGKFEDEITVKRLYRVHRTERPCLASVHVDRKVAPLRGSTKVFIFCIARAYRELRPCMSRSTAWSTIMRLPPSSPLRVLLPLASFVYMAYRRFDSSDTIADGEVCRFFAQQYQSRVRMLALVCKNVFEQQGMRFPSYARACPRRLC